VQILQRLVCEPSANMTDIPPAVILPHREGKRSKERPCALWSREPGNNDFLTLRGLYLQPVVSTGTGQVFAVGALGHDPFEAFSLGFLKEFSTALLTVATELYQLVAREDGFEASFSFEQREPAQIVAVLLVLLDIKSGDPETYRTATGRDLAPTLRFAERLAAIGKPVWVRFTLVPGLTDDPANVDKIARFVAPMKNVEWVEVQPDYKHANTAAAAPDLVNRVIEQFRAAGCRAR
jgi:hypothetical protein